MSQTTTRATGSFPLRPREKHGDFKAINKRSSNDLQALKSSPEDYCNYKIHDFRLRLQVMSRASRSRCLLQILGYK